jgi:DNA topoisomerase I
LPAISATHLPLPRASYVDPRLIDLFNDGATISPALAATDTDLSDGTTHGKIERAVLSLLGAAPDPS